MMKKLVVFTLCVLFALSLFACGAKEAAPAQPTAAPAASYRWDFVKRNGGVDALKTACEQKGTIEELAYETPLYVSDPSTIVTKHLWVYLPYGYDQSKQYNVMYLMHGGGESEIYWLADERWGETTRNVLDNMIQSGVCDPFIVVTPTFYPPEGDFENPQGAEDLTYVFADELRNDIVPFIEAKYSTYAGGDVSEANLAATREHRAFAGLSMGSMTSIHSALMQDLDLFAWVGSFSGAKTEVKDFQDALNADGVKDLPIKFWYNGNGKADIAHDEHDEFCHGVLEAMPERFTDGENFAWVDLRDGSHSYQSWIADLYNCMLVFFK